MKLKLVRLTEEYRPQLEDMMTEWTASGEHILPAAIRRHDFRDFEGYINELELTEERDGLVPATTLFCLDEERNIFVGAVDIRHYLNDGLLFAGGHIGDGVRPSERRKGIATKMIALALGECKKARNRPGSDGMRRHEHRLGEVNREQRRRAREQSRR